MKYLFGIIFAILIVAGVATHLTTPEVRNEVPVIYWVIDPAPVRSSQIAMFHKWLIEKGHGRLHTLTTMAELHAFRERRWSEALRRAIAEGNADGAKVWDDAVTAADLPLTIRVPVVEMRLDPASNDLGKKLVQGVSGVAGDVLEAYGGGLQMRFLCSANMLADVTELARKHDFGPDKTYPALAPALFVDGRQYAFPRNPAQGMYWVNKATFVRHGQPLPPTRWTIAEFEARGRAFVAAANPSDERQTIFFADRAPRAEMRRSVGVSLFNETLTKCALDDPRFVEVLETIYRWTYEDHILPTPADLAAFDTEGGWGSQSFQLFHRGHYGLCFSGRWALMKFREFDPIPLAVVEPPHGGMPNTTLRGGQSTVYRGSRHKEEAALFLAFMADEAYNRQIVDNADALPPNPVFAQGDAFSRPPAYTNEWGCHDVYADAARSIAIVQSFSPFVLPVVAGRLTEDALSDFMNGRATAEEAVKEAAARIDAEIEQTLAEIPALRARYTELCQLQARIDERRARGEPVPEDWLKNPFHRRYYRVNGWIEGGAAGKGDQGVREEKSGEEGLTTTATTTADG